MALSGTGRELWPPGLVTSNRKDTEDFSAASTMCDTRLPAASSWPPPPSLRAIPASIRSRYFVARNPAPFTAALSSPQVSAIFTVRRGLYPALWKRIRVSAQIAAWALSSNAPRA